MVRFFQIALILIVSLMVSCGKKDTGSLFIYANGEEFVQNGFVEKNGWRIDFSKLLVNIVDVHAYNPQDKSLSQKLNNDYLVDLTGKSGSTLYPPLDTIKNVPVGNYQSLSFSLKRLTSGEYKGASIVMVGTAHKNEKSVPFTILLDEEMTFDGKDGYVGDGVKGLLKKDKVADLELTFHFDHIFGDKDGEPTSHINTGSVGFDFFLDSLEKNEGVITQDMLKSKDSYKKLLKNIWTLGHLGEGHCAVSNQSSKDF